MQAPRQPHIQALQYAFAFLRDIVGQGILLKANDHLTLQAFSDSSWASCPDSRRSVTGYLFLLGSSPIS